MPIFHLLGHTQKPEEGERQDYYMLITSIIDLRGDRITKKKFKGRRFWSSSSNGKKSYHRRRRVENKDSKD